MTDVLTLAWFLLCAWTSTGCGMLALAIHCNPASDLWSYLRALSLPLKAGVILGLAFAWPYAWRPRRGRHR